MAKFEMKPEVPVEVRAALEPILAELEWMVPGWVQKVLFKWESNPEGPATMSIRTSFEYRWCCVTVNPYFLNTAPERRLEGVIHELLHAFTCPWADWMEHTLGALLPDEGDAKLRAVLDEELRQRHEGFVQDMAYALRRHLRPVDVSDSGGVGR